MAAALDLTRKAPLGGPASFDREARTVRATLATDAPVTRRGPDPAGGRGEWIEVLDVAASPWPASVPLLADHRNEIRSLAGVVEAIAVRAGRLEGTLRLAPTSFGDELMTLIEASALQGVSVGYALTDAVPVGGNTWRSALNCVRFP